MELGGLALGAVTVVVLLGCRTVAHKYLFHSKMNHGDKNK
ncbi:hypothetical protein ALPO108162_08480 [Alicyclobacillus pomorum]